MAGGYSLKDQLFNAEKVGYLAGLFRAVDPGFDPGFEGNCLRRFPDLELKQRIAWIAECLGPALPADFPAAAAMIEAALPPPLDPTRTDDDFGDFIFAPLGDYAVIHGLEHHRTRALDLLEALTQRFSMEYAIRHFINRWPDETFDRFGAWAGHPNYHVRRLVSEGSRPKLPWGAGIATDPARPLPLLDRLHGDPARFVTRSVANHLNDLSKIDAAPVLATLIRWREEGRQDRRELDWMTRHALRDLVKKGHSGALTLLGYRVEGHIEAELALPGTARIGERLDFAVTLRCDEDLPVLVDYVMRCPRPGGKERVKVHRLKMARLGAGRPLTLTKSHRLPADASTYRLHPGPHRIAIQVNGRIRATGTVTLTD
ncbi:hypothetical protein OB2597_00415 [Pseudooceanicola batsensis HTCC2597]|uniref:DNA alkylation repair enzyme n=1 Tax=Pseudooceanicola batsensis (strain ATCC BAA-863 / DSM 15984 / KCTC 12145 / HTCC2597) TaxID=252305 RepID=A3U1Q0_PSEBH|nr:hypothetical protein [Pseudooceanicola batsensis]EAQ01834.1 hypothetical protein OB2597_00415 [Pseudooceanicola batsensis HTCC2597]